MDGRHPAGGSAELADLIDRYGEILLPELNHEFGIDLRELFSDQPPFSPRYVLAHIKWLPIGSAFIAEMRGGQQYRGWNEDRYAITRLIDLIAVSNYLFLMANRDPKKRAPEPPEPYPTPDNLQAKKRDKPGSFGFIAKTMLAESRRRKAALHDVSRGTGSRPDLDPGGSEHQQVS